MQREVEKYTLFYRIYPVLTFNATYDFLHIEDIQIYSPKLLPPIIAACNESMRHMALGTFIRNRITAQSYQNLGKLTSEVFGGSLMEAAHSVHFKSIYDEFSIYRYDVSTTTIKTQQSFLDPKVDEYLCGAKSHHGLKKPLIYQLLDYTMPQRIPTTVSYPAKNESFICVESPSVILNTNKQDLIDYYLFANMCATIIASKYFHFLTTYKSCRCVLNEDKEKIDLMTYSLPVTTDISLIKSPEFMYSKTNKFDAISLASLADKFGLSIQSSELLLFNYLLGIDYHGNYDLVDVLYDYNTGILMNLMSLSFDNAMFCNDRDKLFYNIDISELVGQVPQVFEIGATKTNIQTFIKNNPNLIMGLQDIITKVGNDFDIPGLLIEKNNLLIESRINLLNV